MSPIISICTLALSIRLIVDAQTYQTFIGGSCSERCRDFAIMAGKFSVVNPPTFMLRANTSIQSECLFTNPLLDAGTLLSVIYCKSPTVSALGRPSYVHGTNLLSTRVWFDKTGGSTSCQMNTPHSGPRFFGIPFSSRGYESHAVRLLIHDNVRDQVENVFNARFATVRRFCN